MLYAGASRMFPFPGYDVPDSAIGAAVSADGITFTRTSEPVLTGLQAYPGAAGAIVADPELALVDGTYHLWFSSLACLGGTCETLTDSGIGHATSPDGIAWTVQEAPVRSLLRASADPKTGGQQPTVIYDAVHCRYEMWLTNDLPAHENDNQPTEFANMVGLWHADSTDGMTWSINYVARATWYGTQATPDPGEQLGLRTGADRRDGRRLMVYVATTTRTCRPASWRAAACDGGHAWRDDVERGDARPALGLRFRRGCGRDDLHDDLVGLGDRVLRALLQRSAGEIERLAIVRHRLSVPGERRGQILRPRSALRVPGCRARSALRGATRRTLIACLYAASAAA